MSRQSGGKNSLFEKNFQAQFASLDKKLVKLEGRLQNVMLKSMSSTNKSNIYWNAVRREINDIYKEINIVYATWAKREIPKVYAKSIATQMKRINKMKSVQNVAKVSAKALATNPASRQIVRTLFEDAMRSMISATEAGKTNMFRVTRATQQTLISEGVIDLTVAEAFVEGNIRAGISTMSAELKKALSETIANERFVQAGSRKYKPSYYAQMVSRVKFHEAQAYSALATAGNYGTDLVIVSSHNTKTVICQEFEGKIFSKGGKDPRFPVLTQVPPFHVNCLHLLFPTFVSTLEMSGTLKSFSDFSLGKVNRPPNPAGFIPVSDRIA
ncbi:hypothetical protein KAR91_47430 [Candidatus Pacearchaeota archaeon]|nr:hypothetical protein [Candidatus Pacearchaeota archaeon]